MIIDYWSPQPSRPGERTPVYHRFWLPLGRCAIFVGMKEVQ